MPVAPLLGKSETRVAVRQSCDTRLVLCLAVCLSGCFLVSSEHIGPFEKKIVRQIRSSCPVMTACQFRIRSITSFDWDTLCVFNVGSSKRDREQILGTKDDGWADLESQLVFMKNGKIVFQESEGLGVEEPLKNEVFFDTPSSTSGYKSYGPDAVFSVSEGNSKNGPYFSLKQIQ